MNYIETFSRLDFDFKVDLEPINIDIEREPTLTAKLHNAVFFYKSPDNTNTSFYLLTTILNTDEIEEIRKYIWNKNDADLIFYYPNEDREFDMLYAKYSPKINYKESILESFSTSQKDLAKLEKIKHWQFDSGVFWLHYQKFIDKAKYKGIDKELVFTLKVLKEKLYNILSSLISEENELNKVVQALIDRTLYIKFLEDNHIINSHFYDHYFNDSTLDYGRLLEEKSNTDINKLFKIIHEIFNNALFDKPTIDDVFLTNEVCKLIAASFNTEKTGQLRLFDFQFDVLPVEFISSIYEVFLSEKQKENGIYYTPKKLAQLIVDEVINEDRIGSILDPSCGSGMFLIIGFQRLIEIAQKQKSEPENNIEKLRYRIQLLSENIFGIEKELTAQRFTLFSLSLQIFKNIPAQEIKLFIANELEQNNEIKIFKEFDFYKNIIHQNTLDFVNPAFKGRTFDYIVGNPPFFEIPNTDEFKNEILFLNSYKVTLTNKDKVIAQNIVGKSQISQCFFVKIKDWSNENTRFGFVSNSSNFYNDYSESFQNYFYSNYGIEKIYELSRVKGILFEKAKESVLAIIFNNTHQNNNIDYYSVDKGLFSEKPFELLIIQEDKVFEIEQKKLVNKQTRLRDFLVGNEFDLSLIDKIGHNLPVTEYIKKSNNAFSLHSGLRITGRDVILKTEKISVVEYERTKKQLLDKYKNKFSSKEGNSNFNIPFLSKGNIKPFIYSGFNNYLGEDISQLRRTGNLENYFGERILWVREGKEIIALFTNQKLYFDTSVYVTKLTNRNLYFIIVAILNSQLINFYVNILLRKRINSSHPKIGKDDFLKLPIPRELDNDLVTQISNISKGLTEGKFEYGEKEEELNDLIYDLYDLSYLERQRIKDYFLPDAKKPTTPSIIKNYEDALKDTIEFYFSQKITVENVNAFNLRVIKICFGADDNPTAKKVGLYTLEQIFKEYQKGKFFLDQECIFGKDCVYILKKDINQNFTETKAFEDGQNILKFTPYEQ